MELWAEARARFGGDGDFLFGEFGAADIMFAPVVHAASSPIASASPRFAAGLYAGGARSTRWMQDWIAGAQEEEWVIEQFEQPPRPEAMRAGYGVPSLRRIAVRRSKMHVDVGIVAAVARPVARADRHEDAIGVAAVLQVMAVARRPSGTPRMSPARITCLAVILDQHRLAREHHDQLVLALVPVALRRPGAGLQRDMADAPKSVSPPRGASRRYQRPCTALVDTARDSRCALVCGIASRSSLGICGLR